MHAQLKRCTSRIYARKHKHISTCMVHIELVMTWYDDVYSFYLAQFWQSTVRTALCWFAQGPHWRVDTNGGLRILHTQDTSGSQTNDSPLRVSTGTRSRKRRDAGRPPALELVLVLVLTSTLEFEFEFKFQWKLMIRIFLINESFFRNKRVYRIFKFNMGISIDIFISFRLSGLDIISDRVNPGRFP